MFHFSILFHCFRAPKMEQNWDGGVFQFSGFKIINYTKDETLEHEETCQINCFSVMQKHFSGKTQVIFLKFLFFRLWIIEKAIKALFLNFVSTHSILFHFSILFHCFGAVKMKQKWGGTVFLYLVMLGRFLNNTASKLCGNDLVSDNKPIFSS